MERRLVLLVREAEKTLPGVGTVIGRDAEGAIVPCADQPRVSGHHRGCASRLTVVACYAEDHRAKTSRRTEQQRSEGVQDRIDGGRAEVPDRQGELFQLLEGVLARAWRVAAVALR
jgi:hypothetical protein